MMIITKQGNLYYSKTEDVAGPNKEQHFNFEMDRPKFYSEEEGGSISTSSGQSSCLMATHSRIELWDLNRVSPLTKMQLSTLEDKRIILCSGLNPDGHSFCIGTHEKLKFYRILINKFRQYAEYPLKKCRIIQYSHGGQLLACISGEGPNTILTIVNTLSLKEIHVFKIGFRVSQVIWNEHDDQIYLSGSESKCLNVYRISTR